MAHPARATEGDRLTPAEAFSIIGNETRLEILQVLYEQQAEPPMTFSELRKRIGMRDGSQFNYHLKKLEGPFIRKTDDGYAIRIAGCHVILTILEGTFTANPKIAPFETGGTCVACAGALYAEYTDEMVYVSCSSCELVHAMGMFPPGAVVTRTDHEVVSAFNHRNRHSFELSVKGMCSTCGGTVLKTLIRTFEEMEVYNQELAPTDFPGFDFGMRYQCAQCNVWNYGTPGKHLLTHPAVVAFYHEHDIDLSTVPFWELDWVISNQRTSILTEAPLRVRVTIPLANEALQVTLDERFEVCAIERTATL
ncbi:ArsR/SmtB family transcription factor [Haladaptatus sp. ZSTT2]|uniref:ArsR/SmtB family transcription factor n=1 Tax=Haladaptatus sp. ZSTT2 TaxID=3120515 RepID=UPI00300ECC49